MAIRRETVVGVFRDPALARDAVGALRQAGFPPEDVSLLIPHREGEPADVEQTGAGVVSGAVAGGLLGGLAGWLIGIGALVIPGIGPFIAAGALATTLAGAAIGAGVGVLAGALVDLGVPEEEARWYESEVRGGRSLVAVRAGARADDAEAILHRHGAYDVEHQDAAAYTEARRGTDTTMGPPIV